MNEELGCIIDSLYLVVKKNRPHTEKLYGCILVERGLSDTRLSIRYSNKRTLLKETKVYGYFKRNRHFVYVILFNEEPNNLGELFKRSTKFCKNTIKISPRFDAIGNIWSYIYKSKEFTFIPDVIQ